MKNLFNLVLLLCCVFTITSNNFAQGDVASGQSFQIDVPPHIQTLNDQIRLAEINENWEEYYSLREQIKEAWQQINPEVAALYRTTNSLSVDASVEVAPKVDENTTGMENPVWGDDLLVHTGNAADISLVVNRGDSLFLAALNNTAGHVSIYVSADGGLTWSVYTNISVEPSSKIELLDYDGFEGSTGPSYLLLFTLYDSGTLWCTRFTTPLDYVNSQVVTDDCTDFAVDRNYPGTNYRCFVLYDSADTQYHKRSDPASYATLWQDPFQIFSCEDPGIAYGLNGSLYLTYIGRSSGNLYLLKNYNFGDPAGFVNQHTVETGSTDTTFAPAIIASRHDTSSQTVVAVYEWLNNGRRDLRTTRKVGGSGWSTPSNWSSALDRDNKNIELFSRKMNDNDQFQAVFTRTGLNNINPRAIRYRKYSSGNWNSSIEVSGTGPTGLQSASVVETNTGLAAYAYAGINNTDVYFDKEDWVTGITTAENIPEVFSLEQNYPNPFNPATTIRFNVPEQTHVSLKIFNSIGQEVSSLFNGVITAGTHEINFDASKLSSGIYFYQIQTESFKSTKKMILMK